MRLLSLEVANYRNIAAAQLEPGRELTVICGNNGQGKTNLLEAIWLLTGGKSFRGGKDAELVRRGETFAVLEAVTQRTRQEDQEPDEPANVRITVGTPDAQRPGRYASVNGSPPKRAAGLAGSFPAVVFDPGHLSLVKGAPEGRRRFLDAALCQLYPGYLATYRRYVRALQQKNALLRHSAGGTERPWAEKCALLEVLNVELAAQGEAIQKRRREYLALLTPLACANYAELSEKVAEVYYDTVPKEQRHGKVQVTASTSFFVPKPFTPFQWAPMCTKEQFLERASIVNHRMKEMLNKKSLRYNWHEADVTVLEGVLARGDRKVAAVIEEAYRKGAIYDSWSEYFNNDIWMKAFETCGVDIDFYTTRERSLDEVFPWDFIDAGVTKDFLKREWANAQAETVTPNCRMRCSGCGVRKYGGGVCFEERA